MADLVLFRNAASSCSEEVRPGLAGALHAFLDLIEAMDATLVRGGWLSADRFDFADCAALPARVRARPSYQAAVARWAPVPIVHRLRTQGEAVRKEVEPLTRRS